MVESRSIIAAKSNSFHMQLKAPLLRKRNCLTVHLFLVKGDGLTDYVFKEKNNSKQHVHVLQNPIRSCSQ